MFGILRLFCLLINVLAQSLLAQREGKWEKENLFFCLFFSLCFLVFLFQFPQANQLTAVLGYCRMTGGVLLLTLISFRFHLSQQSKRAKAWGCKCTEAVISLAKWYDRHSQSIAHNHFPNHPSSQSIWHKSHTYTILVLIIVEWWKTIHQQSNASWLSRSDVETGNSEALRVNTQRTINNVATFEYLKCPRQTDRKTDKQTNWLTSRTRTLTSGHSINFNFSV